MIFTVEELVINDSFILYALEEDERAIDYWNDYLLQYPQELQTVQEAKELVLGLKKMLQKKQNELSAAEYTTANHLYIPSLHAHSINSAKVEKIIKPKVYRITIAASILALIACGIFYYSFRRNNDNLINLGIQTLVTTQNVMSKYGERKIITLVDGTHVTLNAFTELKLSDDFGKKNRNVYLTGEALFEVAHNKNLPFIVHVKRYKVKAVGTKFNVKAYDNDAFSETALLEGKVQILLNEKNKNREDVVYKTLDVNQKFVMSNNSDYTLHEQIESSKNKDVVPLSYDDTHRNIETAWVSDLMIFENESLDDITKVLERRYNVTIKITNNNVKTYKYSASFKNESLEQVLNALQLSYPFAYKMEGNEIYINK